MTREEKSNEPSSGGKYGAEPHRDDLLWKDLLARFFVPMLQSLLPDLARNIDGEREVVFLVVEDEAIGLRFDVSDRHSIFSLAG